MSPKSVSGPDPALPSDLHTHSSQVSQSVSLSWTCSRVPGTVPMSTLPGIFQGSLPWESSLPFVFISLKSRPQASVSVSLPSLMSVLTSPPWLLAARLARLLPSVTPPVSLPMSGFSLLLSYVAVSMMNPLSPPAFPHLLWLSKTPVL